MFKIIIKGFASVILIIILLMVAIKIISSKNNVENSSESQSYNDVLRVTRKSTETNDFFRSNLDGSTVRWQGKISNVNTQISGIKFCILDHEHANIDINKPCDWFWASSNATQAADNLEVNPSWDGNWVDYILNYYGVLFEAGGTYTIVGKVDGIDCGVGGKCVPNIEILDINK